MMRTWNGSKRKARVLVVDDNKTVAQSLSAILQGQGYEVATAFSGEEAVAKTDGFLPDLLLSDVWVGAMNGIEAATRITATLPDCRVLFLSGYLSMADVVSAAPEGLVYSFASKPINSLDLLNAIAYMLPAANEFKEPGVMAIEDEAIERYAPARLRALAGFILRHADFGAAAAAQTNAGSLPLDCRLPGIAGLEMRLQ
jgi:CheY-like chemotaxis protein